MKRKNNDQVAFDSISGSENWQSVRPVTGGDSADLKYYIQDRQEQEYFLKVSEMAHYERRKLEFGHMHNLYNEYACVPRPLEFGVCLDGKHCYTFNQWVNGDTVTKVLQMDGGGKFGRGNPEYDKYMAGVDFGVLMQKIHTPIAVWNQSGDLRRLNALAERALQNAVEQLISQADKMNLSDSLNVDIAKFIKERFMQLPSYSLCLLHGDIRLEHAIMTPLNGLLMTGFADWSYGHPHAEIAKLLINFRTVNQNFLTGIFDGYFTHRLSSSQLQSFSFYVALALLQLLVAKAEAADDQALQLARIIVSDFDGFRSTIPGWYPLHT